MTRYPRFLTSFSVKPVAPYNYPLTVHKPAGWSFLTPYEIYENSGPWTAARTNSGQMIGLKLTSKFNLNLTDLQPLKRLIKSRRIIAQGILACKIVPLLI